MADKPQHRDEPTESQPPNDPMGFGGAKARAGYGKYPGTGGGTQSQDGVPGASGEQSSEEGEHRGVAKGDRVTEEMNPDSPLDAPGQRQALHGGGHDRGTG